MRILGVVLDGIDGIEVTLEARFDPNYRVNCIRIVGLAEPTVKEGLDRARSAVWPLVRDVAYHQSQGILINLAPADLRKSGRTLDLPLAMVYAGLQLGLRDSTKSGLCFLGELGLSGSVRAVRGVFTAIMAAKREGRTGVVLPEANLTEARLVEGPDLYPVQTVMDAIDVLSGKRAPDSGPRGMNARGRPLDAPDFRDVKGQFSIRRACEIAASGRHNLLMEGPPGSGKTMMARRLPSILPPLTEQQALDVARITSVVRNLDSRTMHLPPFRAPHHSATPAGLIGGGQPLRPGEFSLAHHGVLFMDEFPEFDRRALEMLREPMEERVVHITRATAIKDFPADFLLVAAMNPCPCGYHGKRDGRCRCTERQVTSYRGRISGPLLDRFDLRVLLRPVTGEALLEEGEGEPSASILERVLGARERQTHRFGPGIFNSTAPDRVVLRSCGLRSEERRLLVRLLTEYGMSARALRRLQRVSRTLADLAGEERVTELHLMEASGFRLSAELEGSIPLAGRARGSGPEVT